MYCSYNILISVISLFGWPPALDARGRRPPLHDTGEKWHFSCFDDRNTWPFSGGILIQSNWTFNTEFYDRAHIHVCAEILRWYLGRLPMPHTRINFVAGQKILTCCQALRICFAFNMNRIFPICTVSRINQLPHCTRSFNKATLKPRNYQHQNTSLPFVCANTIFL